MTIPSGDSTYRTKEPNAPIELGQSDGLVRLGDQTSPCKANVTLAWLPQPRVHLKITFSEGLPEELSAVESAAPFAVEIEQFGQLAVLPIGWRVGSNADVRAVPATDLQVAATIGKTAFAHLVNFHDVFARQEQDGTNARMRRGFVISDDTWHIAAAAEQGAGQLVAKLREQRGFAITHALEIQRVDGTAIETEAFNDLLSALRHFLSFARGSWTSPILALGDPTFVPRWRSWAVPNLDQWEGVDGWMSPHHAEVLQDVFPGFARLWRTYPWQQSIQSILYWYVHSNTLAGGLDGSIILSQAALELLAWVRLVEEDQSLSAAGFRRLTAADQIKLALSSLKVPLAIPRRLSALSAGARADNWTDGPTAIAEIRNAIVHPNLPKRTRLTPDMLYEAWNLQQWYIERALLRLCGFDGACGNRLRAGRFVGAIEPLLSVA